MWSLGALGERSDWGSESSSGAEVTTLFCSYKHQNAFDGPETWILGGQLHLRPPSSFFLLLLRPHGGAPISGMGFGGVGLQIHSQQISGMGFRAPIELQSHSQPNSLELRHLREFLPQALLSFLLAGRALTYICRQKKTKDILMENHGSARMNHMRNAWSHEAELNKNIMSIYAPTQTEAHGNTISRISLKPGMPFWQSRAAAVPGINRTPFFCKLARKSHTHCSIWQQLCCVWNMFGAILSCISKDTPLSQQGLRVIYLRRGVGSGCESSSGAVCKSRIPANYKKIIIRMKTRSAYKVGKVRISRKKNIPAPF